MKLTLLALGVTLACAGIPQFAAAAKSDEVVVLSELQPPQIAEYVAGVEVRLASGQYDVVKPRVRAWMVAELANLKKRLAEHDRESGTVKALQTAFAVFEARMIGIEEGGIVCERNQRTGSRMVEKRCMTRKRQAELREESRDSMRGLGRVSPLPQGD